VRLIAPEYEPAANPAPSTETVTAAGATPPDGLTESQPVAPVVTDAAAENVSDAVELVTEKVCGEGFAPPVVYVNDSEAGVTVSDGTVDPADILRIRPFDPPLET
jgi:hypothetical protein